VTDVAPTVGATGKPQLLVLCS